MLLIARFYQNFSGERTFYALYLLPLVLFGVTAVRYASIDQVQGDILGDALSAVAGIMLTVLSLYLLRQMMAGRKR